MSKSDTGFDTWVTPDLQKDVDEGSDSNALEGGDDTDLLSRVEEGVIIPEEALQ